jgi:hypothetical protein
MVASREACLWRGGGMRGGGECMVWGGVWGGGAVFVH